MAGVTGVTHERYLKCLAERNTAMEMARQGRTSEEIEGEMGWTPGRIMRWRRNHKDWWDEYRRVQAQVAESPTERQKTYDGTFTSFRRVYLGMETTWFQAKAIEAIEATEMGEVTMILWPPEHGKTTLLEDYCTWKIAENYGYRVTVGSETLDHGIKIIERVQNRYKPDGPCPTIHTDFGPLAPDKDHHPVWQSRRFNVALRATDERDYNMSAIGIRGRIQGTRCDLLLLDDMQDLKSLDQSDTYFNLVVQSFLSRPSMFGRTVIIGTRVGEFDVYRKLIDANVVDHLVTIPAYDMGASPTWPRPEAKPNRKDTSTWAPEGVKFLWPEKYDVIDPDEVPPRRKKGFHRFAYAKMRYQVGEATWWRVYMQKPEAATSMAFDEKTTEQMVDEHRTIIADPDARTDGSPVPVIIGVDPALGGGNGIMAAAAYFDRMDILDVQLDYELTKYDEIVEILGTFCQRWSTPHSVVTLVVVEDKAFQKGLLSIDSMVELQRRYGFRIIPNTTGSDKSSPDIGIPAIPLSMIRHEITMPWADDASQQRMRPLLDQLHIWRPGTRGNTITVKKDKVPQDLVMALWFVWRHWRVTARDTTQHMAVDHSSFAAQGSPLRRRRSRQSYRSSYLARRRRR